jgi:hypothetical protein
MPIPKAMASMWMFVSTSIALKKKCSTKRMSIREDKEETKQHRTGKNKSRVKI